jgi:hypothetical protein
MEARETDVPDRKRIMPRLRDEEKGGDAFGRAFAFFNRAKSVGWPGLEPLWAKPRKSVCGQQTRASLRCSSGHPRFNQAKALPIRQAPTRTRGLEFREQQVTERLFRNARWRRAQVHGARCHPALAPVPLEMKSVRPVRLRTRRSACSPPVSHRGERRRRVVRGRFRWHGRPAGPSRGFRPPVPSSWR